MGGVMTYRKKILAGFAAAAVLGGSALATSSPAQAWCGYYGCGYGYGDAALAAGIVGGLAVGAIAANAAHEAHVRDEEARRAHYAARRPAARKGKAIRQVRR